MKVLIVVAIPIEGKALISQIEKESVIYKDKLSPLKKARIYNNQIGEDISLAILELEKAGNVESGIKTFQALSSFIPNIVILTGICGGFKSVKKLRLGNIIIPDRIIYYEFSKLKDTSIERRFSVIDSDKNLLSSVKKDTGNSKNVIFEPMLTGEKVIATESFYKSLIPYYPDIVAVEMEAYGVHEAIKASGLNNIKFLMIKGVGDWADNTKSDNSQELAANIAAEFVVKMLKRMSINNEINTHKRYLDNLHYQASLVETLRLDVEEEVRRKESTIVAKEMKAANEPLDKIIKYTGLSAAEIEQL